MDISIFFIVGMILGLVFGALTVAGSIVLIRTFQTMAIGGVSYVFFMGPVDGLNSIVNAAMLWVDVQFWFGACLAMAIVIFVRGIIESE